MDIQAEKLKLILAINDIEDIGLIKKVKKLIDKHSTDWFDALTAEQQQSIDRGLEQADRGEFITDEEAKAKLGL